MQYRKIKQIMSIYSGFATRQQQYAYNSVIADLIDLLQRRILKFYTGTEVNDLKFHSLLTNIHHRLRKMEQSKYLQPKFSNSFKELLSFSISFSASKQSPSKEKAKNIIDLSQEHQSMNFSREQLNEYIKQPSFGKIKHQHFPNNESAALELFPNPQEEVPSMHDSRPKIPYSKSYRSKKWVDLRVAQSDQGNKLEDSQQPKKHFKHLIRQYIRRTHSTQKRKSSNLNQ